MKVFVTTKPEEAVRCLVQWHKHVLVRRQRFFRPVTWFRPNLLKDLPCWWDWDSNPRRPSQIDRWNDEGGILFHYPRRRQRRGIESESHYHEQMPISIRMFSLQTAYTKRDAVLPLPASWDYLLRSVELSYPRGELCERVYDTIIERQRSIEVTERSIAAASSVGLDPPRAAILTSSEVVELSGLDVQPREFLGIARALFLRNRESFVYQVLPRIRPFDETSKLYDWIVTQPACDDGFRMISADRMFESGFRRSILFALKRDGYVLMDPILRVFDLDRMNPDFGLIDVRAKEALQRLQAMIRFVEGLPELALSS